MTFTPRGVADNDNRWLVQFKSGSTPYIILADNNCPVAVNTDRRVGPALLGWLAVSAGWVGLCAALYRAVRSHSQ